MVDIRVYQGFRRLRLSGLYGVWGLGFRVSG